MSTAVAKMAGYTGGGKVKGPGTGTSDSIPVRLSAGEFVVPADSVKKIGLHTLKALVAATHKHVAPKGNAPMRRMANGGLVDRLASGIRNLVTGGGTGSANPQNLEARQAAGLAPTPPAPPPAPPAKPVDPNNPAGIQFANGGYVGAAVKRMANGGLAGDDDQPTLSYADQMKKVGGAIANAAGSVVNTVVGAPGYGLNRLVMGPTSPATAPAPAPIQTTSAATAPLGAADSQAANPVGSSTPIPTLNGASGVTVAGAPGVSKFVQNGSTLYTNVTGADNDTLMSGKPGVQTAPAGPSDGTPAAGSAVAAMAAPQAPIVLPDTGGYGLRDKATLDARNASISAGRGMTRLGIQREQMENQKAIAQLTSQAGVQGHQITADASRYAVDTSANTAAQKLAVEAPEAIAKTQAAQITLAAQRGYAAALATGDQKKIDAAQDQLRAAQGKWERTYPELFKTTALPATVGPDGTRTPSGAIVTDSRTGDTKIIYGKDLQSEQQAPPVPASKDKLVAGQTYQTARGPARWDGKQFVQ